MKKCWVYIICSTRNGTLYVGITSNISRRIYEHQQSLLPGFTKKHQIKKLVYLEEYSTMDQAMSREKRLKRWNRAWKIQLIEEQNPHWLDRSEQLLNEIL